MRHPHPHCCKKILYEKAKKIGRKKKSPGGAENVFLRPQVQHQKLAVSDQGGFLVISAQGSKTAFFRTEGGYARDVEKCRFTTAGGNHLKAIQAQ